MSDESTRHPRDGSVNVLRYATGWRANCVSWGSTPTNPYRFAITSFLPEYVNYIDIVQRDEVTGSLVCRAAMQHYYPPTKVMFAPKGHNQDQMITTADYLRLWTIEEAPPSALVDTEEEEYGKAVAAAQAKGQALDNVAEQEHAWKVKNSSPSINATVKMTHLFDNSNKHDFCSPVTSCDWNPDAPNMVATSSIDTSVIMWDLNTQRLTTQLIAHDKDVYDVAFAAGIHTFASCSADGSVRLFDLREMEHCTIVYESAGLKPLLRVAWNKLEPTYLATFTADGTEIAVVDIRFPSMPVGTLTGHTGPINSVGWAPHSSTHLCSAGEDKRAIIWDLAELPNVAPSMYLTYDAVGPINSVSWSAAHDEWMACTTGEEALLLHV